MQFVRVHKTRGCRPVPDIWLAWRALSSYSQIVVRYENILRTDHDSPAFVLGMEVYSFLVILDN